MQIFESHKGSVSVEDLLLPSPLLPYGLWHVPCGFLWNFEFVSDFEFRVSGLASTAIAPMQVPVMPYLGIHREKTHMDSSI
jgi:hypothetical protein